MKRRSTLVGLFSSMLALLLSANSQAQWVEVSTMGVGAGTQYNLTANNAGGILPVAGLSVMNGGTVFGLSAASTISTACVVSAWTSVAMAVTNRI